MQPVTKCSRSIRCQQHATGSGTPPRGARATLVARAHQSAVWDRTRQVLRMRSALLQYFPAAVEAFEDLAAPDALSVLRRAPNPDLAAKLTRVQLVAAPRSARRHHVEAKAGVLLKVLRAPALRQPATLQGAYPSVVLGQVTIIAALQQPDRWTSRGHERTTRGKARSLALRGRRVSCWPATPPTDVSAPRCICKPSPRSGHRRKPAPTTMRCDDETSATTPPFANSPTRQQTRWDPSRLPQISHRL